MDKALPGPSFPTIRGSKPGFGSGPLSVYSSGPDRILNDANSFSNLALAPIDLCPALDRFSGSGPDLRTQPPLAPLSRVAIHAPWHPPGRTTNRAARRDFRCSRQGSTGFRERASVHRTSSSVARRGRLSTTVETTPFERVLRDTHRVAQMVPTSAKHTPHARLRRLPEGKPQTGAGACPCR